jgi:hypothetical protein
MNLYIYLIDDDLWINAAERGEREKKKGIAAKKGSYLPKKR